MSTDNTKSLIRQYIESVWNRADLNAFEDLITPNYAYHLGGQSGRDKTEMRKFIRMVHNAFPDWRVQIVHIIAEGNMVAVRWEGEAIHQGVFHRIPATGKKVKVSGTNVYKLEGGKVAVEWEQMDSLGMLQQLKWLS